ncbi:hypothetical protein CEXT_740161 [Caerostris extrusa]|uniref:Uncharacterized protein n=1 Tax=Caerostris extrusa TaxID=172846 RepID=A0AAV4Q6U8_CAEEX|nr:hypothetical protein CEXT_740161 [Caerostris extrusa]
MKKHHNTTEESSHKGHEEEFPIPEFVVLCGFFATFAVEEALHYILYHCRRRNTTCDRKVRFCSCAKRHTECSRTFKAENPEQTMFGLGKNDYNNVEDYSGTIEQIQNANLLRTSLIPQHVPNYGSVANMTDPRTNEAPPIITAPVMIANNGNVAIVQGLEVLSSPVTISTSNLLFVLALSFYATCQGTTIGLLTQSSPWITLVVACLQQTVLVFIVGWIGVAQSELISPVVAYVLVLSFMSPFGISLAMFLEEKMSGISPLVSGFSKAVVCGSILYLTFCDLLRRRKLKESPHIERFAGFTLGAAAMAALEYVSMII